jgi:hypothetical protein
MQSWGLNHQLCACSAVTLPTKPHPQPEMQTDELLLFVVCLFEHLDILCLVLFGWLFGFKTRFLSVALVVQELTLYLYTRLASNS